MITYSVWKNTTFFVGVTWLLYGAVYYNIQDWDVPVSLLMAGFTYLTADKLMWAVRAMNIKATLGWLVGAWWSIDGVYTTYWALVNEASMLRNDQWLTSLCLYLLCGVIWAVKSNFLKPA